MVPKNPVRWVWAAIGLIAAFGTSVRAQETAAAAEDPQPSPRVHVVSATPSELPSPLPIAPETVAPPAPRAAAPEPKERATEFLAAPMPLSNPTLGSGLGVVGAALFPLKGSDAVSPPSVAGVGGFYTSNHSYVVGAAMRAYIHEDRWRLLAGLALGKLHYDLFPVAASPGGEPSSIPLVQEVKGFSVEGLRRVSSTLFLGARYVWAKTNLRVDATDEGSEAAPPERDRSLALAALGLRVESDSRDSTTYPLGGALVELHADFYDGIFGGARDFQSYKTAWNAYWSPGSRQVIAARLSTCDVRGDAPVYTLCLFGLSNDLRGYDVGRYLGRVMFATQVEYRWTLPERLAFFSKFGFVAFAGVGEVAQSYGELSSAKLLPSGGLGVRFLLAKENRINFRIDYAWGRAGSQGVYVGVGEAF